MSWHCQLGSMIRKSAASRLMVNRNKTYTDRDQSDVQSQSSNLFTILTSFLSFLIITTTVILFFPQPATDFPSIFGLFYSTPCTFIWIDRILEYTRGGLVEVLALGTIVDPNGPN